MFLNSQCAKPKLVDPMENERRETLAGIAAGWSRNYAGD